MISFNNSSLLNFFFIIQIIFLPFSPAISNILFVIFILLFVFNLIKNNFKFKVDIPIFIFLLMCVFTLINFCLQGSYTANKNYWKLIPIIVLGFPIISQLQNISLKKFQKASVYSCLIYVIFCLLKTIIFYFNNKYIPFGNDVEIYDLLSIHRPYLGFYLLMNIYFCFDLNLQGTCKKYYIINFIFISFLILILARLSIITLIISIFIFLFFYSKYSVKIKSIIFLLLSSIILSFMLINPNSKERFNYESFEKFQDYEPRFVIWKSVSIILNNDDYNPFIGYGNSKLIEDYLVINYENEIDKEDKMNYYVNERFNTHSQYLDYLLMGGIPLLLLFLSFIISLFVYFRKDYLSVIILISIISFWGVENLFTRQLGCYLFIFYIGFSYLRIKNLNNNSNFN